MDIQSNIASVNRNTYQIIIENGELVRHHPIDLAHPPDESGQLVEAEIDAFHQLSLDLDIVDCSLVHTLDPAKVCFKIRDTLRHTGYSNRNISNRGLTPTAYAERLPAVLVDRISIRADDTKTEVMIGFVTKRTVDTYDIYEEPFYVPVGDIDHSGLSKPKGIDAIANACEAAAIDVD